MPWRCAARAMCSCPTRGCRATPKSYTAARAAASTLYGVGPDFAAALQMRVASGEFLPPDDPRQRARFVCSASNSGARTVSRRQSAGQAASAPVASAIAWSASCNRKASTPASISRYRFIPVGRALECSIRESLQEIHVVYEPTGAAGGSGGGHQRALIARHGAEDLSPSPRNKKCLDVFGTVLDAITLLSPQSAASRWWSAASASSHILTIP